MDRVVEQVRHWRDELLNLSRRDRVLYYKPTRRASLLIEAPTAVEVLAALQRGKRGLGFSYPLASPDPAPAEVGGTEPIRLPDELKTQKADREDLEVALRTLERRTTQEFMDKGIWVLYLALGFIKWVDTDIDETIRTPVVLLPVALTRAGPRDPFRLVLADEEPTVNTALAVRMADFGVQLPELPDLEDLDLEGFLRLVEMEVRRLDWTVTPDMAIDVFSFHKDVMYRDLKENEGQICANEVIRALALGKDADTRLSFEPPNEDELDDQYPPEQLITIRDADASQRRCIVASRLGHSFVMDGPPGTGKSQTISNIIAQALVDGRSVLFVSEKIAALEVVKARLDEVGLGEYLLELHSHKSTRKEVAEALYRSLSRYPSLGDGTSEFDIAGLISARKELSGYASAMNELRQPLGITLHDAIGRVSAFNDLPQAPLSAFPAAVIDSDTYNRILSLAADLSRAWGPVARADGFLWRGVLFDYSLVGGKRLASERVDAALDRLNQMRRIVDSASADLELWWNEAPSQAPHLGSVLRSLASRPALPSRWLTISSLKLLSNRVEDLRTSSATHTRSVEELEKLVGRGWRTIAPASSYLFGRAFQSLSQSQLAWKLEDGVDAAKLNDLRRFVESSIGQLERVLRQGNELGGVLGLQTDEVTLGRCIVFSEVAALVGATNAPEESWLDGVSLARVQEAAFVLRSIVTRYNEMGAVLMELFKPSILNLELHELKVRFESLHKGVRKLGRRFRADKRLLAQHTYTGKASKKAIAALGDAVEWRAILDSLRDAEARYADRLGEHYYQGVDTRFEDVAEALSIAAQIIDLAGSLQVDRKRLTSQIGRGGAWTPAAKELGAELGEAAAAWLDAAGAYTDAKGALLTTPLADLVKLLSMAIPHLEEAWAVGAVAEEASGRDLTVGEVRQAVELRALVEQLEASVSAVAKEDGDLLGSVYDGLRTDWEQVEGNMAWAEALRQLTGGPVDNETAEKMLASTLDPADLEAALKAWHSARDGIGGLFHSERRAELVDELDSNYEDARVLLQGLKDTLGDIDEWVAHTNARNDLVELGLGEAVSFAEQQSLSADRVVPVVERATLEAWIDWVLGDSRLQRVRYSDRDAIVDEFRRLDRHLLDRSAVTVVATVNSRRPQTTLGPAGVIARQGVLKRRHMPVRELLRQTAAVTQLLKPCFMMSPLSVSQFLPPEIRFDVVIFDEASQVRPEDAANCIYRGHQLVVAGDQKQLPPTDFFQRISMDGDDEYQEDQVDEFESVLDLAKAGGMESLPLRWHYRSQHESLITYSNYSFYEGGLITFPGALDDGPDVGIELFFVEGTYRRGGARDNVVEAEKVAERVLFHAKHHPHRSLGVVAFSEAQASTIEYVLDRKRAGHSELDNLFSEDRLHGFFVKNLENVQGDERDLMIFSIGYGPDEAGKITMNFGPLNKPGGWRRLNVAITRARRRVEIITSILPEHFHPTSNEGTRHLQRYLDFAQKGISALALELSDSGGDAESPFEEEVARVIRSWGYDAIPQVGVASYRVDVGVVDPIRPGRYILGVECDGAMYHSSRVARDRDRLRQEVLEGLGWVIHRIWGTSWYLDRKREERRLLEAIQLAAADNGGPPRKQLTLSTPVELVDADLEGMPDWAVPYQLHRPWVPSWLEMTDPAATPYVVEAIKEVVRVEGPVSKEVVLRRVREAWGVGRAGHRIRAAFDSGLRQATTGSITQDRRHFLWSTDKAGVEVRYPTEDPVSNRDESDVADEEFEVAVLRCVGDARQVSRDELTAAVARIFGWARRGSSIAQRLDAVLRRLIGAGKLSTHGDSLTLGGSQ